MIVLIDAPTIIGGIMYDPSPIPQTVPDNIGKHLVEIGNARPYETKVVAPKEVKVEKKTLSASQPDLASQEQTPKKRRGRPRKSSS